VTSKRTKPKGSADAAETLKRPQGARQAAKSAKAAKGSRASGKGSRRPPAPGRVVAIGELEAEKLERKSVNTERRTDHLFKAGQPSANPNGRPKGSRNKLSESFIARMHADFEQHGDSVIEAVRTESPGEYLRIIASIVPKQFGIEEGSDNVFIQVWQAISDGRA
jgi:hypothetical protein